VDITSIHNEAPGIKHELAVSSGSLLYD